MKRKLYIIGAGGTASYLLPVLVRTLTMDCDFDELIIIDRDVLEEKNVDRQLYDYESVGQNKVEVLARSLRDFTDVPITTKCEWFTASTEVFNGSCFISCTDNHPARLALLEICDEFGGRAVICGNETFSADAYYYTPEFRGSSLDPRVRYPEIVTDKQDDPTRPPCNDEASLETNPQLAAANSISANFGMHLAQLWFFEIDKYNLSECLGALPIEYSSTCTSIKMLTHKDLNEEK